MKYTDRKLTRSPSRVTTSVTSPTLRNDEDDHDGSLLVESSGIHLNKSSVFVNGDLSTPSHNGNIPTGKDAEPKMDDGKIVSSTSKHASLYDIEMVTFGTLSIVGLGSHLPSGGAIILIGMVPYHSGST